MQLLGVILCGGKSSRMGTDKGLLKKDNSTWAEIAFKKINSLSLPAVVSVNSSQKDLYLSLFPEEMMVVDQPMVEGPLNGILTIHQKYPDKNLFVLACDLVDVTSELLVEIYNAYKRRRNLNEYFVYKNQNYYEPLCGIYTSSGLAKVLKNIEKGSLENYSMKNILQHGRTFSIDIDENIKGQFLNYNEPSVVKKNSLLNKEA